MAYITVQIVPGGSKWSCSRCLDRLKPGTQVALVHSNFASTKLRLCGQCVNEGM